jgi:hypothetical protein
MTISEFETKRMEKLVRGFVEKRRPEPLLRPELDIGFRIDSQSFEIFEIRPGWNDPSQKEQFPVAKATYVKSRKIWKLFWMRADLKWHSYSPFPESPSLEKILDEIDKDSHGCFWG